MRIEGGIIPEKNNLYLEKDKIESLVSDLSDKKRRKSYAIEKVSFFLKIKHDGEIEIVSVGTKKEIISIKERRLGFRYQNSIHQTESYVMRAVIKQIADMTEDKKTEKVTSLKLTAFLGRKKDQWFFEEIGTIEEIGEILEAKNVSCFKPEVYHIEMSKTRGEFLRKLEASPFVKLKEPISYLF